LNFAAGFFDIRSYQTDYHQEIIVEANGFNNTLAPYETCSNANTDAIGNYGSTQAAKWAEVYLQSALSRLQSMITGYNLTTTDLINMQSTCAYEVYSSRDPYHCHDLNFHQVVALGSSKFCDLFTSAEWEGFEYYSGQYLFFSVHPRECN
jgi:hypothetical protein